MFVPTLAIAFAVAGIPAEPERHHSGEASQASKPEAKADAEAEDSVSMQGPLPEAVTAPPVAEGAPQSFLLAAHAGAALRWCATGITCRASLGPSVGARFDFRLVSWFSLGIDVDWVRFNADTSYDAFSVSHRVDAWRALVVTRVHWLYSGAHDVSSSVGVGYGAGYDLVRASARTSDFGEGDTNAWQSLSQGPLGRAAITWLWRSPLLVQVGPELALDYWYATDSLSQQRGYQQSVGCGGTSFACARPSLWARENLAWSLRLVVALPFGGRF